MTDEELLAEARRVEAITDGVDWAVGAAPLFPQMIEALARALSDARSSSESLEAYKDATGIVASIAGVDSVNRALVREAERGSRLALELEALWARLSRVETERDQLTTQLAEVRRDLQLPDLHYKCGCPVAPAIHIHNFCPVHYKVLVCPPEDPPPKESP